MPTDSLPTPRDGDGSQPALRVYLVEDSSIIRHNLVEALRSPGWDPSRDYSLPRHLIAHNRAARRGGAHTGWAGPAR